MTKSSRGKIEASTLGKRVRVSWHVAYDTKANHMRAAMELIRALEWYGEWTGGEVRPGEFCWVFEGGTRFTVGGR